MIIPPRRLCLSGGGIKGIAHIGALEALAERGLLRAVREVVGISAGALCAFTMAVGCELGELRRLIEQLDFGTLRDLEPETMLQFPDVFGLDTGANLDRFVVAILRARGFPADTTFGDLAAAAGVAVGQGLKPQLRLYATDLNTCRIFECSASASPDLPVRLALRASMCIPFYFQPVQDPGTGHFLVDGGVICHSPLKFLSPAERAESLAISFGDTHKPVDEIGDVWGYLRQIYYALDYEYHRELVEENAERTILLPCGRFNSLHFELDVDQRRALMDLGKRGVEKFLRGHVASHQKPVRRNSL